MNKYSSSMGLMCVRVCVCIYIHVCVCQCVCVCVCAFPPLLPSQRLDIDQATVSRAGFERD